jgi:glycerol-3-phosphate dehydrogenase (NAD(P)+)
MVDDRESLRLLVIGYGAFGRALAAALPARGDIQVEVFSRNAPPDATGAARFLHDLAEIDFDRYAAVVLALPSRALVEVLSRIAPATELRAVLLSCMKGMDAATGAFPTEVIAGLCPGHPVGMLSGPTFASEMAAGHRVWMSLASNDRLQAERLAVRLAGPRLGLQATADLRGLEIIGVTKNIIALGAGLSIGLGLGENTRASYVARGIRELGRLLPRLGGEASTLLEPGALGDIILTCTSAQSRNYRFGLALGEAAERHAAGPVPLAEGQQSIETFLAFLRRAGVESSFFENLAGAIREPEALRRRLLAAIDEWPSATLSERVGA